MSVNLNQSTARASALAWRQRTTCGYTTPTQDLGSEQHCRPLQHATHIGCWGRTDEVANMAAAAELVVVVMMIGGSVSSLSSRPPARVRLLLSGDVNLNSSLLEEGHNLSYPWDGLRVAVRSADLFLVNHEGAVVNSTTAKVQGQLGIHDVPSVAHSYHLGNVSFVSLANNHQLGFGSDGLRQTMRFFDSQGIAHAGAGFSAAEAAAPAILRAGNATVAVFATIAKPVWRQSDCEAAKVGQEHEPAKEGDAGQNYQPLSAQYASQLVGSAKRAKAEGGVDFVVAFFHWGCNWDWMAERDPTAHAADPSVEGSDYAVRQQFARGLIDSGAVDVVWGTSSHHIQPVEIYRGKPIIYGPGNTLFQKLADEEHMTNPPDTPEFESNISKLYHPELSFLYAVELSSSAGDVAASVEAIPTAHDYSKATILDGAINSSSSTRSSRAWLRRTFDRISSIYSTHIVEQPASSSEQGWRVVPTVLPPSINASFEGGNADPAQTRWVAENTVQYLGEIKCGLASTKCSPYTNWAYFSLRNLSTTEPTTLRTLSNDWLSAPWFSYVDGDDGTD